MTSYTDPIKIGLSSNSKKIKKTPCQPQFKEYSSPQSDAEGTKKYNTYTKSQKLVIIEDLRKALSSHFTGKNHSADGLIRQLEIIKIPEYNAIIEDILAQHAPSCLKNKQNKEKWLGDIKQWRRQLKAWIKNIHKPENRGSARVVSHERTDEFKQKIASILKGMTQRSFTSLRKQAINALEEMHKSINPDQPFNRNTFSKHFWYDFKKIHPEIETLYKQLPPVRTRPDQSSITHGEIEQKSLSSPQSSENDVGIFMEQNQSDWLDLSLSDQNFSFKNLLENKALIMNMKAPETHTEEIVSTEEEDRTPQSLYYNQEKVIIEPEENDRQRNIFRRFYYNGI